MKPVDEMVAPCGRYCGDCMVCGEAISIKLALLTAVFGAAGLRDHASKLAWPVMRSIAARTCDEFDHDLTSLKDWTRTCFPRSCRAGCVPPCKIPSCCAGRGLDTCAECPDYEGCAIANLKNDERAVANIGVIRRVGIEEFSRRKIAELDARIRRNLVDAIEQAPRAGGHG